MLWQLLFLVLSTTWLWAPHLNHVLSYRTALISQYEAAGAPFSWLFRLGDVLGAILLVAGAVVRRHDAKVASYLLLVIGLGMMIDPIWSTTCHTTGSVCMEYVSPSFIVHAVETVVTSLAIFVLASYDACTRKRLVSIAFVVFQLLYGGLFLTQLADHESFNTVSQYAYQLLVTLWLAWFYGDFWRGEARKIDAVKLNMVKRTIAVWAFLNGLLAILVSLIHLHLLGRAKSLGLYFAGNHAWLAQHGVIVGVIMLYLSRQLARGELRARQILLVILGIEALAYSVVTPSWPLMVVYFSTFCILFVIRDAFDRGVVALTLKMRLKDVLFMVGSLVIAALLALGVLFRTPNLARITIGSIDHFFDYTIRSNILPKAELRSALLAHTMSAFLMASIGVVLWILFRPYKKPAPTEPDYVRVRERLTTYSTQPDDYFKLWPPDKSYFWSHNGKSFIAYKTVGSIAFVLADPIGPFANHFQLLDAFIAWARGHRLRVCILPIFEHSLPMYEAAGLNSLHIGSSASVQIDTFLAQTIRDKWWRWQQNRAIKNGYEYFIAQPPHNQKLMGELRQVSAAWLGKEGRQEHGFALGYFDETYLQECAVHYLRDSSGRVVAFANQLPTYASVRVASVDLIRHMPEISNAMPYLLLKTIETVYSHGGYEYFDLGFVPFAAVKNPVLTVVRTLSGGRFSSRGLEQFKNKFKPEWRANYLAYDGDMADLALVAMNLEKAMKLDDSKLAESTSR